MECRRGFTHLKVRVFHPQLNFGGVAERFKAPDLNSGDPVIIPGRGFESYRLFYFWKIRLTGKSAISKVAAERLGCSSHSSSAIKIRQNIFRVYGSGNICYIKSEN